MIVEAKIAKEVNTVEEFNMEFPDAEILSVDHVEVVDKCPVCGKWITVEDRFEINEDMVFICVDCGEI